MSEMSPPPNRRHPDGVLAVSILIPTRNRRAKLAQLIERILADPDPFELVVVDDASDDGTMDMLEEFASRHRRLVPVRGEGRGASSARLLGARAATGDLLVLLDDDVLPAAGLAAAHAARHTPGDRLLVLGYMPTVVPDPVPRGGFATVLYAQEYVTRCAEYESDPSLVMTGLWLGNASISRAAYLEAFEPGAMPDFPYRHQDRLLGIVLRELGVTGVFDRSLYAQHVHARPLAAFLSDSYDQGRGRAAIKRLYPEVLPEPLDEVYLRGMSGPLRSVVAATRNDVVRKVVTGTLSAGIRGAGRVRATRLEMDLAKVARRVALLHGAREGEALPPLPSH